jgi:multidrug efflux pump subunit AcrB
MDREKAGLMGLTASKVGGALTAAASSSRYVLPNYWADSRSGIAYQVQVEVPQSQMTSLDAVKRIPVRVGSGAIPMERFDQVVSSTTVGEYDRYNMQRMLTLTLRMLERDGMVRRTVTPTIPPRVDYELTDLGRSLLEPVQGLGGWAQVNMAAIEQARAEFDARTLNG